MSEPQETTVKVRANSPGKYPILIVELPDGGLQTAYFETGYDLDQGKTVDEDWLRDNALGRHSFVAVNPPAEVPAASLEGYVRRELLGGA